MRQHLPHACDHPAAHRLLALLATYRFATTTQLARLTAEAYGSLSSAIRQTLRHLARLQEHDLVTRLERRVGGWQGGSTVSIWTLTTRGRRVQTGSRSRQRPCSLSTSFLAHLLAITETSVQITETTRSMTDASATITTEPGCWRSYLGPAGQQLTLRPDLHAVVASPRYDDHYFIEVDRDTENPARVIAACHRYQAYYATGAEQRQTGVFPITLWVVPHDVRREQLWHCITEQPDLDSRLFAVITAQQIAETITGGPPSNEYVRGGAV